MASPKVVGVVSDGRVTLTAAEDSWLHQSCQFTRRNRTDSRNRARLTSASAKSTDFACVNDESIAEFVFATVLFWLAWLDARPSAEM